MTYYLDSHRVFTLEELDGFLSTYRTGNPCCPIARNAGESSLSGGGLFASTPKSFDKQKHQIDPYLSTSKSTSDAILSHHTALEVLGKAHSTTRKASGFSKAGRLLICLFLI